MSPTRRKFLRTTLPAAALGFAGCADGSGSNDGDPGPDATARSSSGTDHDPAVRKPRNPRGDVVVRDSDGSTVHSELITDGERIDELAFASGVPTADAESARSFLDATDFAEESIYVRHVRIDSCERYRIHSVSWSPGHVEFEYCRELRPPDHACVADRTEGIALLFRLPVALEGPITRSGSSGHSPCDTSDTDYRRIDANATVPNSTVGDGDSP